MTWLVFAVSGLLVLAGAVSIVTGVPIVQIERGWTEVIAGTVALSGGCIAFALGVVLLRLREIRNTLTRPTETVVHEAPAAALTTTDLPVSLDLRPTVSPTNPGADLAPVAVDPSVIGSETRHGLWKRVRRPTAPDIDTDAGAEPRSPDDGAMAPLVVASSAPLTSKPEDVPLVDIGTSEAQLNHETVSIGVRSVPAPVDDIVTTNVVDPSGKAEPAGSRWKRPSLFRARTATTSAEPDEPLVDFAGLPHDTPVSGETADQQADVETAPETMPVGLAPATIPDAQAEPATVVGRYQAGVASYVMYSDGSIHVETEGGETHRFGSMEELKAFIARQDTPAY